MLLPPLCRVAAGAEAGRRRLQGTELRLSSAHGLVSRPVESLATLQSELVEERREKPRRASHSGTLSVSGPSLGFSFTLCLFIELEALMWEAPGRVGARKDRGAASSCSPEARRLGAPRSTDGASEAIRTLFNVYTLGTSVTATPNTGPVRAGGRRRSSSRSGTARHRGAALACRRHVLS